MVNNQDFKILHFNHVADTTDECARVAIAPSAIKMIASRDIVINDRALKLATICFTDGETVAFNMSAFELNTLEEVVAGYSFGSY